MAKRKIIKIDAQKCTGCGLCIPDCPEGAIQIIDGKARLISDLFCDGLGACLGSCPQAAITVEEREAEKYDEKRVMENAEYLIQAMDFLKERKIGLPVSSGQEQKATPCACLGSKVMDFKDNRTGLGEKTNPLGLESQLGNWPVQLMLVPPFAPYLDQSDLLIAADCVPFAYADFHQALLKERVLLVGCPKLDDLKIYREKISRILQNNRIKSLTYAHMQVPCCFGLVNIIKEAIAGSGKDVAFEEVTISIKGERLR